MSDINTQDATALVAQKAELEAKLAESEAKKAEAEAKAKAEAEEKTRIQKELDQAKFTLTKKKQEAKKQNDSDEEDESQTTSFSEVVAQEVDKRMGQVEYNMAQNFIESEILAATTDEVERAQIRETYKNRIVKSGLTPLQIKEDVSAAMRLVQAPKLQKRIEELNLAQNNSPKPSVSGAQAPLPTTTLSPEEEAYIKKIAASTGGKIEDIRARLIKNKQQMNRGV